MTSEVKSDLRIQLSDLDYICSSAYLIILFLKKCNCSPGGGQNPARDQRREARTLVKIQTFDTVRNSFNASLSPCHSFGLHNHNVPSHGQKSQHASSVGVSERWTLFLPHFRNRWKIPDSVCCVGGVRTRPLDAKMTHSLARLLASGET